MEAGGDNQDLSTPLYPQNYPGGREIAWIIQSKGLSIITLQVSSKVSSLLANCLIFPIILSPLLRFKLVDKLLLSNMLYCKIEFLPIFMTPLKKEPTHSYFVCKKEEILNRDESSKCTLQYGFVVTTSLVVTIF